MKLLDNDSYGLIYQLVRRQFQIVLYLLLLLGIYCTGVALALNGILAVGTAFIFAAFIIHFADILNMALRHIAYIEKDRRRAWQSHIAMCEFSGTPLNILAEEG